VETLPTQDDQHEFDLCPPSHPRAFDFGGKCCKPDPDEETPSWSEASCKGEVIYCSGLTCENDETICTGTILIQETENEEFDGFYTQTDYSEANRPLYASGENCIWWYRAERHWWIGSCQNVGTNEGFAYLETDDDCPGNSEGIWRSGITNEVLSFQHNELVVAPVPVAGSDPSPSLGGTSGVNVVKQNRHYRQTCKPKYIRGQLRCQK
jgi:hypothetical protein